MSLTEFMVHEENLMIAEKSMGMTNEYSMLDEEVVFDKLTEIVVRSVLLFLLKSSVNYSDAFHPDLEAELIRSKLWLARKPIHLNRARTVPSVVLFGITRLKTTCTQVCSWLLIICVLAYRRARFRKRITKQTSRHSEKIKRQRERLRAMSTPSFSRMGRLSIWMLVRVRLYGACFVARWSNAISP